MGGGRGRRPADPVKVGVERQGAFWWRAPPGARGLGLAAPDAPAFHDTLGWLRFLRKDYAGARAEMLKALAGRPTRGLYFYHLGMVEFAAGRRSRAERALRLALKLQPEMPEAATARATLKIIEAAKLPGNE